MFKTRWAVAARALSSAFTRLLLAALTVILIVACSAPPPEPQTAPFYSTEVSGLDYGRGIHIPDTEAHLRSLDDFKGSVAILFFGFTSCPDVCPTTLAKLKAVRTNLGKDAQRIQVVLISVDPERDNAAKLRNYVKSFDPSFIGLRPEPAALKSVLKEFRAIAEKAPSIETPDLYTVDHSGAVYIYDRSNHLKLITQYDFKVSELTADLSRLIRE